jgi:hypothetical protein
MTRWARISAKDLRAGDTLYGHGSVTAVYQMVVGRSLWATYAMVPGGKEFKRYLGNPSDSVLILIPLRA